MINVAHAFDPTTELLNLTFSDEPNIIINTKDDVDFTELVKRLTLKLETKEQIIIEKGDYNSNPKIKLVFDTVKNIINSYNTVIVDYFE